MQKNNFFLITQKLLPQHLLSRISSYFTNNKYPPLKNFLIKLAINKFNISLDESEKNNINEFKTFNDFFTRHLLSSARPIENDGRKIISPADGSLSQFGTIDKKNLIQAKGKFFSLDDLLGNHSEISDQLKNGSFFTIYLSPRDYHRVHMPIDGKLTNMTYIPGKLFSVNSKTTEGISNVFSRNERVVCNFETEIGIVSIVFVGALLVASIITKWHGIVTPSYYNQIQSWDYSHNNISFSKGEEIGHFQFGSTVICCFQRNKLNFKDNLSTMSPIKMGDMVANINM